MSETATERVRVEDVEEVFYGPECELCARREPCDCGPYFHRSLEGTCQCTCGRCCAPMLPVDAVADPEVTDRQLELLVHPTDWMRLLRDTPPQQQAMWGVEVNSLCGVPVVPSPAGKD